MKKYGKNEFEQEEKELLSKKINKKWVLFFTRHGNIKRKMGDFYLPGNQVGLVGHHFLLVQVLPEKSVVIIIYFSNISLSN